MKIESQAGCLRRSFAIFKWTVWLLHLLALSWSKCCRRLVWSWGFRFIDLIYVLSTSNLGADVISPHHFDVNASDSGRSEHIRSISHLLLRLLSKGGYITFIFAFYDAVSHEM